MIDCNIGFGLYAMEQDGLLATRQGKINAIIREAQKQPIDLEGSLRKAKVWPLSNSEVDYINKRL